MKRLFALMMALLLLCSLVSCSDDEEKGPGEGVDMSVESSKSYYDAGGDYNDRFQYEIINGDEVSIVGFTASEKLHSITIPSSIESRPVVKIDAKAFYHMNNISAVTVPAGITEIGDLAFAGCEKLLTVEFAPSVVTIGKAAFANCKSLSVMVLPASVKKIEDKTFYGCESLATVALSGELTAIGDQAFMNCTILKTVTGAPALATIGNYAFFACGALENMVFPASVTAIGDFAFTDCRSLPKPTLASTVKVGENAFYVSPLPTAPEA